MALLAARSLADPTAAPRRKTAGARRWRLPLLVALLALALGSSTAQAQAEEWFANPVDADCRQGLPPLEIELDGVWETEDGGEAWHFHPLGVMARIGEIHGWRGRISVLDGDEWFPHPGGYAYVLADWPYRRTIQIWWLADWGAEFYAALKRGDRRPTAYCRSYYFTLYDGEDGRRILWLDTEIAPKLLFYRENPYAGWAADAEGRATAKP